MKSVTVVFLLLLVAAHTAGDPEQLLAQPLSMFRDGDQPAVGYALFALLAVIAALMTAASVRARRELEVWVFCLAGFLLAVVAATPSRGPFHDLATLALLGLLYSYFGLLLHAAGSYWLCVYVPAPLALLVATRLQSYGLWQKALIVCFVVLVNIHYHLVSQGLPRSARLRKASGGRSDPLSKRRVVYVLSLGKTWRRLPAGRPGC
jgi:hypothetical protein